MLSSNILPPSKNSSAEILIITGKRGPTTFSTFSTMILAKRARFSIFPPNSSVLSFVSGDKNCEIRYECPACISMASKPIVLSSFS